MSTRLYSAADKPISLPEEVVDYGIQKAQKPAKQSFVLAIFAGGFIALAFIFYITVTTGASGDAWGLTRLAGGLVFSLGLMLVVVCGGELFTSTVLSALAWTRKQISGEQLLRCWGRVLLGNAIGAAVVIALVLSAKLYQLDHGAWGLNALHIAHHKLQHSWWQAFSLAVLCNLLVCLGVWMSMSSKDSLAKSLLLVLPVAMFVSSGFEHSVANLFMVPLGVGIKFLAENGLFHADHLVISEFSDLTFSNFLFKNFIPVVLGNITGGALLIGLGYQAAPKITLASTSPLVKGKPKMTNKTIATKKVTDIFHADALSIGPDTAISQVMILLADNQLRSVPVVDENNNLLGIVSEQDVLRQYWSNEFDLQSTLSVREFMQTEVLTVSPNDPLEALIETMVVDREKLFPVNSSGILVGQMYASYEERLKRASADQPSAYPVLNKGKLMGMIYRHDLLNHLRGVYKPRLEQNIETETEAVA